MPLPMNPSSPALGSGKRTTSAINCRFPSYSTKAAVGQSLPLATNSAGLRPLNAVLSIVLFLLCQMGISTAAAEAALTVFPEQLVLNGNEFHHGFIVSFLDRNGRTSDVTSACRATVKNPAVAVLQSPGQLQSVGEGRTEIRISYRGNSVILPVISSHSNPSPTPSFFQDVEPILTKSGCNQGGCHGKLSGQNGFRLSLRGFAPDWDYDWLVREVNGRRVNFAFPDESLILLKASGGLQHEGGTRFRKDSRAYRMLAEWIHARAPFSSTAGSEPVRLEVFPAERLARPGDSQQLLVLAHDAKGGVRDVTWLAQFFSNDESLLKVKPSGLVKALRSGEGGVRIHFQGLVEVARFTIPFEQSVPDSAFPSAAESPLDRAVFSKLKALRIPPSAPCDDATFFRRAHLDAIGVLPSPDEVRDFLNDRRPDKRGRLVDSLLSRPEWSDYWALQLSDLFQNRKERDHDVRGMKGVRSFHSWIRSQLLEGRGWNEIASSVLLARGDVGRNPAVGYFITQVGEYGRVEQSELPDGIAQAFLGTRVGCARCHNHPLERYTQDDFYHFSAYFSKVSLQRENPEKGQTVLHPATREQREIEQRISGILSRIEDAEEKAGAFGEEPGGEEIIGQLQGLRKELNENRRRLAEEEGRAPSVKQPRTGQSMAPQWLDRSPWKGGSAGDPREEFVRTMISSSQFSGAMVNRIWKHFFGTGLVETVDDLRASNPPTNPELWLILNREFASSNFDMRKLMRLLLNSRAYQLSASTLPGNANDTRYYSHYYARRLPAEVMLDALSSATGVATKFAGHPAGVRAVQIAEPHATSYFLTLFGRSDRVTACACERSGEVTLPQLLHLHNSEDLQKMISDPDGRLASLLKNSSHRPIISELFLGSFSRLPTETEISEVERAIAQGSDREQGFRDLLWALLNSKEFSFNH